MRIVILLSLLCVGAWGSYMDEGETMRDLGNWVVRELSKRTNTDMQFDSITSHKEKRVYNSAIADHQTEVVLELRALRSTNSLSEPVTCTTSLAVPESFGSLSIKSYACNGQSSSGSFYRRSGETPCTSSEEDDLKKEALKLINENIDQTNEDFNMPGMLDMPELQQNHITFKNVVSCTVAQTLSGAEYTLKVDAHQDIDETCDIKITKSSDGSYDVTQNQCQGMN